eukprot:Clim_evm19s7 gene=Clim_evmTU19s7
MGSLQSILSEDQTSAAKPVAKGAGMMVNEDDTIFVRNGDSSDEDHTEPSSESTVTSDTPVGEKLGDIDTKLAKKAPYFIARFAPGHKWESEFSTRVSKKGKKYVHVWIFPFRWLGNLKGLDPAMGLDPVEDAVSTVLRDTFGMRQDDTFNNVLLYPGDAIAIVSIRRDRLQKLGIEHIVPTIELPEGDPNDPNTEWHKAIMMLGPPPPLPPSFNQSHKRLALRALPGISLGSPSRGPAPKVQIFAGLTLIHDAITPMVEREILEMLIETGWKQELKGRKVQHFGSVFEYGKVQRAAQGGGGAPPMPLLFHVVIDQVKDINHMVEQFCWDQATANLYEAGQGIAPHLDTVDAFEGPILSLSLGSDTVMDFVSIDGDDDAHDEDDLHHITSSDDTEHDLTSGDEHDEVKAAKKAAATAVKMAKAQGDYSKSFSIVLPRRSLLVMDGHARTQMKHGIAARWQDLLIPNPQSSDEKALEWPCIPMRRKQRVSLTFRRIAMDD